MKIKRSVLEKIIREELRVHVESLMEAPDVVDAEGGNKDKTKKKEPKKDIKPAEKSAVKQTAKELPVEDEPEADAELEKDVADPEAEEDAEDVTGGKISDQINGKRIQSVTMEPKSKTLPGAQEIVITFNEIPEPLKILVTKTGQVKFHFKGLHNKIS